MSSEREITGTVTYLEKVDLRPGSSLHVSLVDVTQRGDWKTLATEVYPGVNSDVMGYTMTFDPAKLQYGRTYAISANIIYEDQVVFTSTTPSSLDLSADILFAKELVVQIVSVSPNA